MSMQSITDNLHITDAPAARQLPADGGPYDRVISLGLFPDRRPGDLPEASTHHFEFPDAEHEYDRFRRAVDATREGLASNDVTLVHCQAGVSRSASVCTAALAVKWGVTAEEALAAVRKARPVVNPREAVWNSAIRYIESHR